MTDQKIVLSVLESTAYDKAGEKVGKVAHLFVDARSGEPTFVTVNTGLFGHNSSLVPMFGARLEDGDLHLAHTKDQITDAPDMGDTEDGLEPAEEMKLYDYYGLEYETTDQ